MCSAASCHVIASIIAEHMSSAHATAVLVLQVEQEEEYLVNNLQRRLAKVSVHLSCTCCCIVHLQQSC